MTDRFTIHPSDLRGTLKQVIEYARVLLPFDSGGVLILDRETELLAPHTYLHAERDEVSVPHLLRLGDGVIGKVAQTGEPIRIDDVTKIPDYVSTDRQTLSQLIVPMLWKDEIIGIFNVESHQRASYTNEHLTLLKMLADHAALAIATAKQTQTQTTRLDRLANYNEKLLLRNDIGQLATSDQPPNLVLSQIAERLANLVKADACLLTVWDFVELRTQRLAAYGVDQADFFSERIRPAGATSLTREMIHEPKVHIINDAQSIKNPPGTFITEYNARAALVMPIMARGRAIGAAFLLNLSSDRKFTQDDADDIAAVMNQIGLIIDNHNLMQDTRARLAETTVLVEVAAAAATSLDLDDMLRQVLKLCQQTLHVSFGAFLILSQRTQTLDLRKGVWFGVPEEFNGEMRLPISDPRSHAAIVYASGTPYFINDLRKVTLDSNLDLITQAKLRNFLMAPLRVQDQPLGVFIVGNKHGGFTRTDSNLLTAIGSHIASALRNTDLLASTRQRLEETESLQKTAEITSSTLELDEMLERAVRVAAEVMDVEGAILMMPSENQTELVPHERSRYGIAKTLPFRAMPIHGAGHYVEVYHSGLPYVTNNPPSDPIIDRRNIITYPLRTRDRTLGILSLINRKSGEFEEDHLELTRAICQQIATSMDNAQLFAAERARADLMAMINTVSQELTATLDLHGLMRKVVKTVHSLLHYKTVAIGLLDESGQTVTIEASDPPDLVQEGLAFPTTEGAMGRTIRTGETQMIMDLRDDPDFFMPNEQEKWGSAIIVPLRAGTRVLGAIEATLDRPNGFMPTDQFTLETLAAQVSIAVENARLWNQAQRRLLEQSTVHQIGQDLNSILDYNELVNAVVQHLTRAMDTAVCVLTSFDPDTQAHAIEAEYRIGEVTRNINKYLLPYFLNKPLPTPEKGLLDEVVQTRRQMAVYRNQSDLAVRQRKHMEKFGIYAQFALPMIVGDRIIGCLLFIELRALREFTVGDVRLAQTLTTQAAIAIENARLFRQAQRQAREQALLRRIAVSLTVMPDMETLLRQLAWEAAHALETEAALISLRDSDRHFPVSAQYPLSADLPHTFLVRVQTGEMTALWQHIEHGVSFAYNSRVPDMNTPFGMELANLFGKDQVSVLVTPVLHRGETIGLIEVCTEKPRTFDIKEVQMLEAIANQGAVAIDNMSLSEREQRRLRQLEKLQSSSRNITGILQTDALFQTVVREAAYVFDAEATSIMTLPAESEYYVMRAAVGLSDRYITNRKVHIGDITHGSLRPQYVDRNNASGRVSQEQADLIVAEGLKSVLIVSMMKSGQQLGLMGLYAKTFPRPFTDEERELAQLFASQVATQLENARLFEALEDRAVELTKANKLKSEFLARISHELRTPMNAINVFSEMLTRSIYGELNEKQQDRIERIYRNGRNLLALIDDLLDIAKIDAGKMDLTIEAIDLREELDATIRNLEGQATHKSLYLRLETPEKLPLVNADALRLRQITTNLIGNAVKFTKEGGVIVRVEHQRDTLGEFIVTSIIDTGIGIRQQDQAIIFDEFRQADGSATREYGGTGLGLAITKKLVEMMDGRIWVESEPGKGSTFSFSLPAARTLGELLAASS